jgi:hypothetical protein
MFQDLNGAAQRAAEVRTQKSPQDWGGEVRPPRGKLPPSAPAQAPEEFHLPAEATGEDSGLSSGLPAEVVESPVTPQEAYQGSLKGLLARNLGRKVALTFLIGTQTPVTWEGILHSVGNDYLVLWQPERGRYLTGDFYALKFVEFPDAGRGEGRRREW